MKLLSVCEYTVTSTSVSVLAHVFDFWQRFRKVKLLLEHTSPLSKSHLKVLWQFSFILAQNMNTVFLFTVSNPLSDRKLDVVRHKGLHDNVDIWPTVTY